MVKNLPEAPTPSNIEHIKAEAHLQGLPLADPEFGGQLDVLIGGVDYNKCVVGSITKGANSDIAAQPTIFGWTITGPLDHSPNDSSVFQIHTSKITFIRTCPSCGNWIVLQSSHTCVPKTKKSLSTSWTPTRSIPMADTS